MALIVALPLPAYAYTVSRDGAAVGERPSHFGEAVLPQSRFKERELNSTAAASEPTSSFSLKSVNSTMRDQTEKTLSELGAQQRGDSIIVNLPSDVLFDFDKFAIRADARPVLEKFSLALKAMPQATVTIVGHTDSKGDDAYNQKLSEQRAEEVMRWLHNAEVTSALSTEGKGEFAPVADNEHADGSDNPAGRQKNRRVEFIIKGAL